MDRRTFLGSAAASAIAGLIPVRALAATPSVVVIGGGMAGATVAKYIRLWSNKAINVTLIDTNSTYVSNIMSNLVITGQVARTSLNFTYGNLTTKYGVKFVKGTVTSVVRSGSLWAVKIGATTYSADRVVLAPGISMDSVRLLSSSSDTGSPATVANILHAWQAGPQTDALKAQLAAMPNGGTFVLAIPKAPYRCPPGPYERACVVADYLQRNKPASKVVVLDGNASITAEPENFGKAFFTTYASMLTYKPNSIVTGVYYSGSNPTSATGTSTGSVRYDTIDTNGNVTVPNNFQHGSLLNIIPNHRAGTVLQLVQPISGSSKLTDNFAKKFAQVDVHSFAVTDTNFAGIHVIGDAHQTSGGLGPSGLPMAGHVANQEAKICASAIVNALAGGPALNEAYLTANSACYSPINSTTASWLTVVYHYNPASGSLLPAKQFLPQAWNGSALTITTPTEASGATTRNFSSMGKWYSVLMSDSFA